MTAKYAADTSVSVERSNAEISQTLRRYGASQFFSGWGEGYAVIGFTLPVAVIPEGKSLQASPNFRQIKVVLPLPDEGDRAFTHTPTGQVRSKAKAAEAFEQGCRSAWRRLALVIKAKLEAVEAGISTIEREFLADVVLPNGLTVGEHVLPAIEQAYATGQVAPLLALGAGGLS